MKSKNSFALQSKHKISMPCHVGVSQQKTNCRKRVLQNTFSEKKLYPKDCVPCEDVITKRVVWNLFIGSIWFRNTDKAEAEVSVRNDLGSSSDVHEMDEVPTKNPIKMARWGRFTETDDNGILWKIINEGVLE